MPGFDIDFDRIISKHTRALAEELRGAVQASIRAEFDRVLGGGRRERQLASGAPRAVARGRKKAKNIRPCIAPGCQNPSKGPRFRFLCDEHRGASVKQVEEWRAAKKGGVAAASAPKRATKAKAKAKTKAKAPAKKKPPKAKPAAKSGEAAKSE